MPPPSGYPTNIYVEARIPGLPYQRYALFWDDLVYSAYACGIDPDTADFTLPFADGNYYCVINLFYVGGLWEFDFNLYMKSDGSGLADLSSIPPVEWDGQTNLQIQVGNTFIGIDAGNWALAPAELKNPASYRVTGNLITLSPRTGPITSTLLANETVQQGTIATVDRVNFAGNGTITSSASVLANSGLVIASHGLLKVIKGTNTYNVSTGQYACGVGGSITFSGFTSSNPSVVSIGALGGPFFQA